MIQNINLGAAPNDKTGTKARVAGQIINANFAYLEGKIDNVDKIVSETGFSLVDLVFTINAFWEWNLNGIGYTNPEAVSINIPLCASGKKRIDYIVPNSSNTFTIISGIETTGIPAAPSIPNKDMYVSFFTITDILIESPALTIIGENYISKLEKIRLDNVNGIGSYEDWTVGDSRSCFNFSNAVTEFKSFHYHPIVFAYDGKIFTLKNSQATDITLFHNAGTGLFKFRFPNAENFVLHPNEVIEFRLNYEDTSVPKLEFIGTINSISTFEISNVTGLPEALDLKLDASAYNQHFKGVYVTLAALNSALPTASIGDYAQVNEVGGTDVLNYNWDNEESIWVAGGGTGGAANTDTLPEGSTNLYWTVARFLANLTAANIKAALGITTLSGSNTGDQDLSGKQDNLVSGTNIKTLDGDTLLGSGNLLPKTELAYALSDETSNLTVGTLITFRMPFAMTLSSVRISLNNAPTISSVIVDVKENGVSIFSTLLSIDASEKTSVTAATPAVISDINLADDAEITVSTTQIGSGDTGKGLKILFKGRKA